jgi:hypothetical protein
MSAFVFTGPTLSPEEAGSAWDANYLPPAAHGDVYRVALKGPRAIGIIDGYFEGVPSVWHKEILWAMAQGIHVFGGASMGALRAAELDSFGMRGVGKVYEAFRDGVLEDDDEVTVVHGPSELGYRAATEAMVNIRHTLAAAARAGILAAGTRDALVGIAKGIFYKNRDWHYERLLERAAEEALPGDELDAFGRWLPKGRVNQKRDDALEMLDVMRRMLAGRPEELRVDYRFEHTENWDDAVARHAPGARADGDGDVLPRDRLLEELRLDGEAYRDAMRGALLRLLSLAECDRRGLEIGNDQLKSVSRTFRLEFGMLSRKDIDRWLADNHLDLPDFDRLIADEARMGELQSLSAPLVEQYILDHLRATGTYARFAARARDKHEILEKHGAPEKHEILAAGDNFPPQPSELMVLRLLTWYFERRLNHGIPDDIDAYARGLGFADTAAFHRALLREYLYLSDDESQASQD